MPAQLKFVSTLTILVLPYLSGLKNGAILRLCALFSF